MARRVELFRRTHKALTITGYKLDTIRELTNIDKTFDWAIIWAERRKAQAAAAEEAARAAKGGNGFDSSGCPYSIDEVEHFVRESPKPVDGKSIRSEVFHTIVGHYLGCGWDQEKIFEHLQQFPDGVGGRYLHEKRLRREINNSARKFGYGDMELPLSNNGGWVGGGLQAKAPQPESINIKPDPQPSSRPPWEDDPELNEDDNVEDQPRDDRVDDGIEDDELDEGEEDLEEPPKQPGLPKFYAMAVPINDRRQRGWSSM